MRIKQTAVYTEGQYYRIEENGNISFAYGDKSAKKFISEAKTRIELVKAKGVNYPKGLVKAVNDQNE